MVCSITSLGVFALIADQLQQQLMMASQLYADGHLVPQAYYAIVNGIAESLPPVIDEEEVPPPARLYRAMARLRVNPTVSRDSRLVSDVHKLIDLASDHLPSAFLVAAKARLAAYDGQRVTGEVLRNGTGSYQELWFNFLTPQQRVDALRRDPVTSAAPCYRWSAKDAPAFAEPLSNVVDCAGNATVPPDSQVNSWQSGGTFCACGNRGQKHGDATGILCAQRVSPVNYANS